MCRPIVHHVCGDQAFAKPKRHARSSTRSALQQLATSNARAKFKVRMYPNTYVPFGWCCDRRCDDVFGHTTLVCSCVAQHRLRKAVRTLHSRRTWGRYHVAVSSLEQLVLDGSQPGRDGTGAASRETQQGGLDTWDGQYHKCAYYSFITGYHQTITIII